MTTTIITSADELLTRYAAGERSFYDADLSGDDLSEADLRGAALTGAALTGAVLRGANLYRADLTGADLRGAALYGANLSGAALTGAVLYGANLYGANLTGAVLYGANLYGANLYGANLTGAALTGAVLRGANLYRADLTGADLSGANLTGADLSGVKNPPVSSHDFLAEVLRQAAGKDYERRSVAGLVLVSRDWCWQEFGAVAQAHWSPELRAWIAETLAPWPELVVLAQRYHVIEREASPTDNNDNDEGAQP